MKTEIINCNTSTSIVSSKFSSRRSNRVGLNIFPPLWPNEDTPYGLLNIKNFPENFTIDYKDNIVRSALIL